MLAIFNMVPALPMDGGRVFRAVLSWVIGPERATNVSAFVARCWRWLLFTLGVFYHRRPTPMMVIIAMFVFVGAGQEVAEQRLGRVLEGVQLADVVSPYAPRFTPATTLGEAVSMLTMTHYEAIAVEHFGKLHRRGHLEGHLARGRRAGRVGLRGRAGAAGDVPVIDARESLEVARFKMNEAGVPFVAVVREGLFLGLVTELELAVVAERLSKRGRSSASGLPGWASQDLPNSPDPLPCRERETSLADLELDLLGAERELVAVLDLPLADLLLRRRRRRCRSRSRRSSSTKSGPSRRMRTCSRLTRFESITNSHDLPRPMVNTSPVILNGSRPATKSVRPALLPPARGGGGGGSGSS